MYIICSVQAVREQQDWVCSVGDDDKLEASDNFSRSISINSQGTGLQTCRIQREQAEHSHITLLLSQEHSQQEEKELETGLQ